jgi:hypothetical protein
MIAIWLAYRLFEKTEYKHKWHKFFYNYIEPTTMTLYLNVVFDLKL